MNAMSGDQLELIAPTLDQPSPREAARLGIVLDQTAFLQFLSSEWLFATAGSLLLGTSQACSDRLDDDGSGVEVWFDTVSLPDATVMTWRQGAWTETALSGVQPSDTVVSWSGPLPAFAVSHFCVSSQSVKSKLLAMARNFPDMDVPTQRFEIGSVPHLTPPDATSLHASEWQPPPNWDALRGAAAMAVFAVPSIAPWIELLCEVLRDGVSKSERVERLHAPWWQAALWSDAKEKEELPVLWRAMIAQFSEPNRLREWRAKAILESICEQARYLGENEESLDRLQERTRSLLEDRGTVEELGVRDDFLALTLQLLLLRPTPERFQTWREDWRAIPPVAYWTGMTLAGYLQGYRSLPTQFRGTPECRRLLALMTWQHATSNGSGAWQIVTPKSLEWHVESGAITLTADGASWAKHRVGTRGSWYHSNFEVQAIREEAEALAFEACSDSLDQVLTIADASIPLGGSGKVKVDAKNAVLSVSGRIELTLGQSVAVGQRLNVERFKDWLATASVTQRIRRPSAVADALEAHGVPAGPLTSEPLPTKGATRLPSEKQVKHATIREKPVIQAVDRPVGLTVFPDFISGALEVDLVSILDSLEWDRSMKRHVQHHGWRYDYKARQVMPEHYLGPLPDWAQSLALRLLEQGIVTELPDQVIVNNYEGKQGISKHIDCRDCFRGPVVTVSLLETWDMVFTRKLNGESLRFVQPLPRCSAVVLDGEARSAWLHEIPERLKEHGQPRGRRISITFRKVAI